MTSAEIRERLNRLYEAGELRGPGEWDWAAVAMKAWGMTSTPTCPARERDGEEEEGPC